MTVDVEADKDNIQYARAAFFGQWLYDVSGILAGNGTYSVTIEQKDPCVDGVNDFYKPKNTTWSAAMSGTRQEIASGCSLGGSTVAVSSTTTVQVEKASNFLYVRIGGPEINGGTNWTIDLRCINIPEFPYENTKSLILDDSRNALCGWDTEYGTATLRMELV